jgi:hypothetical protein
LTDARLSPYLLAVRRWLVAGAILAVVGVGAGDAGAARRRFGWLYDTETVPERTTEVEWWVWERPRGLRTIYFTVEGVVGLTDTIELGLPLEVWTTGATLAVYGLEARWRLFSADPAKAGPIVPLIRAGVLRFGQTDSWRCELDLVVSIDLGRSVHLVGDAGGYFDSFDSRYYLTGGAGVSVAVTDELGLGAEIYSEASIATRGQDERWLSLGPNLTYTHGRFWVTAAVPFGVTRDAPDVVPRITWAVAF